MVVVCAPVLKLANDGLSPADFSAWVPGWIPVGERSLNLGRIECWLAKVAGRLGRVIHPFDISSVPRASYQVSLVLFVAT